MGLTRGVLAGAALALLPALDLAGVRPAFPGDGPAARIDHRVADADRRVEALAKLVDAIEADPHAFRVVVGMARFQRLASADGRSREVDFRFGEGEAEFVDRVGRAAAALGEFREAHGVKGD